MAKARAIGENEGFVKVIVGEPYGEILGAHIIGSDATEMIAESESGGSKQVACIPRKKALPRQNSDDRGVLRLGGLITKAPVFGNQA